MNQSLSFLKKLSVQQQFSELQSLAQALWDDTADSAVLPLLALAHAQLGELPVAQSLLGGVAVTHQPHSPLAPLVLHKLTTLQS